LVAAGAYPEHSTMAKLKITSFFKAARTDSPQEKNISNKSLSISNSGLPGLP
jgi:hypothetical protein